MNTKNIFTLLFLILSSSSIIFCASVDDSDILQGLPQTAALVQQVVQALEPHDTHPHAWELYLNECDSVEYAQIGDAAQSDHRYFKKYLQEHNSRVLTYWLAELAATHDQMVDAYDQDTINFRAQLQEKDAQLQTVQEEKAQSDDQLNELKRKFKRAEKGRKHYQRKSEKKLKSGK